MKRKALIVGINYYRHISQLKGCISDATKMAKILEHNANGSPNFSMSNLITSGNEEELVKKLDLKDAVRQLFADKSDIALFYFSGHGYIEDTGGYLNTGDSERGDDGFSLRDLMDFVYNSNAKYKFIFLDCCHSGVVGDNPQFSNMAEITTGTAILTASTENQFAYENRIGEPGGVFTNLLIDALNGSAANLVGDVTSGSIYAHIDQALGNWSDQRPVFKTNVKSFVSLRTAEPPIPLEDLQSISIHFPERNFQFQLDPSFEPERADDLKKYGKVEPPNPVNNKIFAQLQKLRSVNLLEPVGANHLWHAAMESKTCKLTPLGEHYRQLANNGLIKSNESV